MLVGPDMDTWALMLLQEAVQREGRGGEPANLSQAAEDQTFPGHLKYTPTQRMADCTETRSKHLAYPDVICSAAAPSWKLTGMMQGTVKLRQG